MTIADARKTAVIVAGNGRLFDHLVESCGLSVAGVASTAVLGEKLVSLTKPDVVLVDNELPGMSGIESLGYLRQASPNSEVVLVVPDEQIEIDSGSIGAYAVLPKSRLADLAPLLRTLESRIDTGRNAARVRTERRSNKDRRVAQDWSRVGWDKRAGGDRRVSYLAG